MSEQDKPVVKKKRRWLKRVLFVLVVLGIGVAAWWYAGLSSARKAWDEAREKIKAHGHPVNFLQLEELREDMPDNENGYLIVEGLDDRMSKMKIGERVMFFEKNDIGKPGLYVRNGIDQDMLDQSKAFLDQHHDILEELTRLEDRPSGRRKMSYKSCTDGPLEMMLPSLSSFRAFAKMLALQSIVAVQAGDVDTAVESNRLILRVGSALENEMTLIEHLVRIGILNTGSRSLEEMLCAAELNTDQLESLQRQYQGALKTINPLNPFRFELLCQIFVCENMIGVKYKIPAYGTSDETGSFLREVMEENMPEETLRKSQVIIADSFLPILDAASNQQWQQLMDEVEQQESDWMNFSMAIKRRHPWSEYRIPGMLMPGFSYATEVTLRARGVVESTVAALAAERYRLDFGHFPNSLDELVPDYLESVPEDPFDDKPLRYARTDEGVVFYTIDTNEVDDGGSIDKLWNEKEGEYDDALDVGFRLLNPENRGVRIVEPQQEEERDSFQ